MATPRFNDPITNPFGLSDVGFSSAPTLADIDGDGDLDAFVGNNDGNTLFYRNTGTAAAPSFAAPTTNPFGLSDVGFSSTPTFADIDGDGDLDAFVGNNDGNTLFYRNTGTVAAPSFAAHPPNPFGLSDVGGFSTPTFADVDGDGDLDAFVGNSDGNTLFYRNTGTAAAPSFAAPTTNPFGLTNVGVRSAPTFVDIDGDGDLDAFVGNNDGDTLFYRNNGTAAAPSFAAPTPTPFGLTAVGRFSKPTFADIDGDGDLDAFVGNSDGNTLFFKNATPRVSIAPSATPSEAGTAPVNGSFLLTLSDPAPAGGLTVTYTIGGTATPGSDYTPLSGSITVTAGATTATINVAPLLDNVVDPSETIVVTLTATATSPYALGTTPTAVLRIADQVPLNFATPIINPFGLTNVGYFSAPTFADIDGDGDLDAFVGNSFGNTLFYRNIGSASAPSFAAPTTNPFGLTNVGFSSTPTLADIDGDGDLDAFVGNEVGDTILYRNTGTAAAPSFAAPATNPFGLTNVGNRSAPTFADIDGDGDLDAFVGERFGNTLFYRNTGTAAAPSFAAPTLNPFGLTDVGNFGKPTFADIDGDGDLDAFVGEGLGNTLFYRNIGSASAPSFAAPSTNPFGLTDVGFASTPTFADIDGDGDLDAFVGNSAGNTLFFENAPTVSVSAGSNAAEPNTPGSFILTLSQAAPDGGITVSYSLSGTATNGTDYTIPVTTIIVAGQTTATVIVTPIDDALVEGSETVILSLTDAKGYNLGATTSASITLTDNDTIPVVSIAATDANAAESSGVANPGTFRISRTGSTANALTVNYAIATGAGQATNGTDYTPTLSGTATIAAGQSFVDFSITPVDDNLVEGNETVSLSLVDTAAYDLNPAQSAATVTIADNDTTGVTIIQSGGNTAVTEGGATDSYTIVLNSQPTADVTIALNPGNQLTTNINTLTFTAANWNTPQTVTVTAVDDAVIEGNHTGTITATVTSADANYNGIAISPVIVAITDNDLPSLSINDVSLSEGNNGTQQATFTVSLSQAVNQAVSLKYATANGTATAGSDYTAVGLTDLIFAAGETSKTIGISITGDTTFEPDETFTVTLSNASGATLSKATGTGTILNDDAAPINVINGTTGRDTLVGTDGRDRITGLEGADTLTGGAAADVFVYTKLQDAGDIITDFSVGQDQIDLKGLFQSLNLGNLTAASAISGGYLKFVASGANTFVQIDADGTGPGRAASLLTVNNVSSAALNNSSNFVL